MTTTLPIVKKNAYIHAATSDNTRKAYQSDIRHFQYWGGLLPTEPASIIGYLQAHATQLSVRTLSRRLIALRHWHVYQNFPDPTLDPIVQKTLTGIYKTHGKPKNKSTAMTIEQLQNINDRLLQNKLSLRSIRDRALILIGFFGAFRRSELVNIHVENIHNSHEGIEIMISRSKTDQSGQGQLCAIPFGTDNLCPVNALQNWQKASHISMGPVFRSLSKSNRLGTSCLSPKSVNLIIQRLLQNEPERAAGRFSSHSLRRGLATSASRNGASLQSIMRQGRWQHEGTVLGYIEEGQRFEDNAADILLNKNN